MRGKVLGMLEKIVQGMDALYSRDAEFASKLDYLKIEDPEFKEMDDEAGAKWMKINKEGMSLIKEAILTGMMSPETLARKKK